MGKGIRNRGSQIHRDKYRQYKKDGILPHVKWLNSLKDEHDVLPCDDIPDTADQCSNRDDILDTKLSHQD